MKAKKSKILTISVIALLVAVAIVMATLAWFTDTDEADNIFTIGDVSIALHDENPALPTATDPCGTDFTQSQTLLPIVNTANPAADANYIGKVVHVENTGANEAYVRVFVAVPAALADVLHCDFNTTDWTRGDALTAAIDGVNYKVYPFTYKTALAKDAITENVLSGVYLDAKVDIKDNGGKQQLCTAKEDGSYTFYDFDINDLRKLVIPVAAQAVQADGFTEGAVKAVDAAFPLNPWASVVTATN